MKTKPGLSVLTTICVFLFSAAFLAVSVAAPPAKADKESVLQAYGKLPLYFIENKGQLDPKVRFYVKTSGQTLYFTDEGIVFDLLRGGGEATKGAEKGRQTAEVKTERLVFNLGFENARKGVLIEGLDPQDAGINYFVGNDRSKWKRGIPTYKGVIYQGIYRGIDLKIFGNGKDIEYEFIVNPGGNPNDILLTYNGIKGLSTNGEGELLIATAFGELKETRPYIYQEIKGEKAVDGSFEIRCPDGQSQTRKFSYGFQVASYNPSYPLIIDPTLSYSTYLGGSSSEDGEGIAVDGSGNAYVTGNTDSTDFPTQNPYQGTYGGSYDAFITKFTSSGSALSYSTYLGGSNYEYGEGIAVDSSGNAYVTGYTRSNDFPTKNAYQGTKPSSDQHQDAFVTKVSSSGSALSYSTYLGGSSADLGYGIAVDGSGNAYVTGTTTSTDFPTQNPYQGTKAVGWDDVFITKLSSSGSALIYSTYLGGSSDDDGEGIAVDSSGNAYVTGYTQSSDFPTQNPYQGTIAGFMDAFITKFTSSGSALTYSTYLGGSGRDQGYGIAVDGSGNAYVTGDTVSSDLPTQNPYQGTYAGGQDAFITKLSPSGSALTYSTYLGGSGAERGRGIAVDGSGNAYVTGLTGSSDFPIENPYQGTRAGSWDAFITKLSSSGSALTYSTYLGGSSDDWGMGIAIDGSGNAYVTGATTSSDFPTQSPYQGTLAGGQDAFVAKLSDTTSPTIPIVTTTTPSSITSTTATSGGNVTSDGGASVTARGVCWSTAANPTTSDSHTSDSTGTGSFISSITGLNHNTTYHVRAYATNSAGTGYGDDQTFTSASPTTTTTTTSTTTTSTTTTSTPTTSTSTTTTTLPTKPTVTTNSATLITSDSAILNGNVNPNGLSTEAYFEYGTTTSYGSATVSENIGAGTSSVTVSASISALISDTTYHYRLTAINSAGTSSGADKIFYTAVVYVSSDGSCGGNTPCYTTIQSAIDAASSGSVIKVLAGSYSENVSLSTSKQVTLSGGWNSSYASQSSTTSVSSLTISNGCITVDNLVLETASAQMPPTVSTKAATSVTLNSVTLNGTVNPNGASATYYFQYGTTTSYGSTTSSTSAGSGSSSVSASASLTGLSSSTTYHFRLVATNSAGGSYGDDQSFTTVTSPEQIANIVFYNSLVCAGSSFTANLTIDGKVLTSVSGEYSDCDEFDCGESLNWSLYANTGDCGIFTGSGSRVYDCDCLYEVVLTLSGDTPTLVFYKSCPGDCSDVSSISIGSMKLLDSVLIRKDADLLGLTVLDPLMSE